MISCTATVVNKSEYQNLAISFFFFIFICWKNVQNAVEEITCFKIVGINKYILVSAWHCQLSAQTFLREFCVGIGFIWDILELFYYTGEIIEEKLTLPKTISNPTTFCVQKYNFFLVVLLIFWKWQIHKIRISLSWNARSIYGNRILQLEKFRHFFVVRNIHMHRGNSWTKIDFSFKSNLKWPISVFRLV